MTCHRVKEIYAVLLSSGDANEEELMTEVCRKVTSDIKEVYAYYTVFLEKKLKIFLIIWNINCNTPKTLKEALYFIIIPKLAIIVFDLASVRSLKSVTPRVREIVRYFENTPILVVGNKTCEKRVPRAKVKSLLAKLSRQYKAKITYVEASPYNSTKFLVALGKTTKELLKKREQKVAIVIA